MPKASEVFVELNRTLRANESRLEAIRAITPASDLRLLYTEIVNVLQENNVTLRLAIGALEEPEPLTNAQRYGRDGSRALGLNPDKQAQIGSTETAVA